MSKSRAQITLIIGLIMAAIGLLMGHALLSEPGSFWLLIAGSGIARITTSLNDLA